MTPPLLLFDPIRATPTMRRTIAAHSPLVSTIARHPHQTVAQEQTMEVLTSPADHPFVLVVGPGGVGKTALIALLDNALQYEARAEMNADPSLRPVIVVDDPGRLDRAVRLRRVVGPDHGRRLPEALPAA